MLFKRFGGKPFAVELNKKEQQILNEEINKQILEKDLKYTNDIDACVLYVLHTHLGFGPQRLRRFWEAFRAEHKKLQDHYDMQDDTAWVARYMVAELDTAFFKKAAEAAVEVEVDMTAPVEDILEAIIQECENTQNAFVDGVPRSMMHLSLSSAFYGKARNNLDKQSRANVDTTTEEFYTWHGVETASNIHLPDGCDILLQVKGAIAQPVIPNQYVAEKIPLSNAYGVELFYNYGTVAVTPDLIFKAVAKST